MGLHLDLFNPTFVRFFFISVVWICGFFILNMTVATMLMKYSEAESISEKGPSSFDDDLQKLGS